jgi:selenocysteine-specific elongation factor
MKSIIIGTAGHIDHGKTALVKALTGIDADRLEEEKRRGITIDLGFAHVDLPGVDGEVLRLGFVDVPGHERFVRNMLAGVGGVDVLLFVIAADESIKPQTREHFDICRLLSVPRGITVLTKIDTIDAETLGVVRLEVEEFLRGSFLDPSHSPVVAVSSLRGTGLEELKQALVRVATQVEARDSSALARLPVDRVFTMKGFGTVVTGTLISGTIAKEAELEVFPGGQSVRVRGVQVHGTAASQAVAGQRTALNLAGVGTEQFTRGMMLAPPSVLHSTFTIDVKLSLLASAKPLKDKARVHFHAYTSETIAKVALLQRPRLEPGEAGHARLRLNEAVLLLPGDRFILRQFSPVVTIGGGVVLDSTPLARKVKPADRLLFLQQLENGSPEQALLARVQRRGKSGLSLTSAVAETGWTKEKLTAQVEALLRSRAVVHAEDVLVSAAALSAASRDAELAVKSYHDSNPLVAGISREELRERVDLGAEVFAAVLADRVKTGKLEVMGEQVRSAGRGVVMRDDEAESMKIIEAAFASAGLKVPALKDVLAGLTVDRPRAQKIVTLLLRDKVLVKISDDLVFHREALVDLRRRVTAQKLQTPKIDVARFKDLAGVSRKYAIPLLEYLDREHVTRRVGDERVIL